MRGEVKGAAGDVTKKGRIGREGLPLHICCNLRPEKRILALLSTVSLFPRYSLHQFSLVRDPNSVKRYKTYAAVNRRCINIGRFYQVHQDNRYCIVKLIIARCHI